MATTPSRMRVREAVDYPTSDGKPMAETEDHRDIMIDSIQVLQDHFAADPMVCVSGNLLMYYVPGDKRRHVSPDMFVVRGVPKRRRQYYLVWEEGRAPDLVIEVTSRSTRREDLEKKFALYRDQLHVSEYILFDPLAEYLKPPLQGFRLIDGQYVRIEPTAGGRLPSAVLGLELEGVGSQLRFYDSAAGRYLPTDREVKQALRQSEAAARRPRPRGGGRRPRGNRPRPRGNWLRPSGSRKPPRRTGRGRADAGRGRGRATAARVGGSPPSHGRALSHFIQQLRSGPSCAACNQPERCVARRCPARRDRLSSSAEPTSVRPGATAFGWPAAYRSGRSPVHDDEHPPPGRRLWVGHVPGPDDPGVRAGPDPPLGRGRLGRGRAGGDGRGDEV